VTCEAPPKRDEPREFPDLLRPRQTKRPLWVRILCLAGAVILFAAGIAGWLIPVITGIPFYIAALIFLGMASDRARGWINALERRLPESWRWGLRRALHHLPSRKLKALVQLPEEHGDAPPDAPGGR
jgi:uncharacterized membrane protein YbaN (DUF454 family)